MFTKILLIKKFLKEVINLIFIIFLLPYSLLIFFFNFKKILNSDKIVYHKAGGFGHSFTAQDLIRYVYPKKKIIYLQFYDPSRFNNHLNNCFGNRFLIIPAAVYFQNFNIKFGEYEGSYFKIIENIILFLIKKEKKSINDFYKDIKKKYTHLKIKKTTVYRWSDIYIYLQKKNKKKIRINNFILNKNYKICTLYLRQKFATRDVLKNKNDSFLRSGSHNPNVYIKMINYLIKKNYLIYLVGDKVFGDKDIIKFKKHILTHESYRLSKNLFSVIAGFTCDLFIGESGGGAWFGNYAKKSLLINTYPFGYKLGFTKVIYKNLYDNNGKKISKKKLNKYFFKKIPPNYRITNNNSKQLLAAVKEIT